MNTYPSSLPSSPRTPPLVVPHTLAARGPSPPEPMLPSRGEVSSRTGLATIATVAAPRARAATRTSFWYRVRALLGYTGRSEEVQAQRRLLVRDIFTWVFAGAQFVMTVALTADGRAHRATTGPYEGQTEFEICRRLSVMNILWFVRTFLVCVLLWWSPESIRSDEPICPLDLTSFSILVTKIMPITMGLCVVPSVVWLVEGRDICREYAPHIFALTVVILSAAALYYTLKFCVNLLFTRGHRRSPASLHLTRAEVDRIALVHYMLHSQDEASSPVSPSGGTPHSPRSPVSSYRKRAHRFILFRSRPLDLELERDASPWEGLVGLPYVRLEYDLTQCSICLGDFEAPPKAVELPSNNSKGGGGGGGETHEMAAPQPASVMEIRVRVESEACHKDVPETSRADGGGNANGNGPPMPLRLLGCGHAFHKVCIDEWLTGHAACCPNCRVPVQVPPPTAKRWRIC